MPEPIVDPAAAAAVKPGVAAARAPGRHRRRSLGRPSRWLALAQIPLLASLGMPLPAEQAPGAGAGMQAPVGAALAAPPAVPAPKAGAAPPAGAAVAVQIPVGPAPGTPAAAPALSAGLDGLKVAGVELKGLKTLSEETLLYYLGIGMGKPLNEESLNRNIRQLWERGLIDDIKIDGVPVPPDGVRLSITVQERPVLRSVDYQGLKRLSKTDVQDKIATQHIKVHEGDPLSLGELQRVKILIEDLYREKGYRFAQASYTVEELTGNEKRVVFKVDEGDRVRIGKIEFQGATVFRPLRLRWAMKNTKESGIIWRVAKKDIYDPAKLQEDLDKIRDLYKGDGYKNVVIGEPKITVVAEHPNAAAIKDQKRRMSISIPIEEGERWKFGQVSMEGNKVYSDQVLLKPFAHKGDAWLRSKTITDGVKKVEELYHNTGYIFAHVEPELVERPNHVADLALHVTESDQFKVGRIEFQGNDRTLDKVLRREVRLVEGGLVNIGAIRNSVYKVRQLGYFKPNEEDPVDIDTNTEKKLVNLVFKGKEADRTELQFGGGWSELDGFFGQFGISTKNFLGRGEQVGASVQVGRRRNLYDVSYNIPWFKDRPQSIGLRAFESNLNYTAIINSAYLQDSKGIVLSYGRNFGLFQSAGVAYTLSKRRDRSTDGAGNVLNTFFVNTSSIRPSWNYDSRDDPFEPVRGRRLTASVEYGGGFLGGNDDFLRPELAASLFQPIGRTPTHMVLAINVEGGLLHPTSHRALSPLEFFFIGGENSIRGHRFRTIVARGKNNLPLLNPDGSAQGGDKYLQANLEYHFLLGGPFRLLLFTDAGNVYAPGQSFNLSRLRYTAGVELRILVPVFGAPLRFIYSKNLKPLPQDSFETFQFSIGTSF